MENNFVLFMALMRMPQVFPDKYAVDFWFEIDNLYHYNCPSIFQLLGLFIYLLKS